MHASCQGTTPVILGTERLFTMTCMPGLNVCSTAVHHSDCVRTCVKAAGYTMLSCVCM